MTKREAHTNTVTTSRPNRLVIGGLLAGSALVAIGLALRFPNLRDQPVYLALVVLSPLLVGMLSAVILSGLWRNIPRTVPVALGGLLSVVLILDAVAFVGPLVTSGQTSHDAAPTFVLGTPTPAVTVPVATATTTLPALRTGMFDARPGPDTVAGQVFLGQTSEGKLVLSLQNLHAANGPDVYVYLSELPAPSASEQVMRGYEVGKLTATTGTINYELPSTLNVGVYQSVVVYCRAFSAIFGYATLV